MRRLLLFALTMLALALTVPWWFSGTSDQRVAGFPVWAAYAVAASTLYAAIIAVCLGRYWEVSADGEPERDEPHPPGGARDGGSAHEKDGGGAS